MSWRKFLVFNFLGAVVWVSVISSAGYLFGRHWDRLEEGLKEFNVVAVIIVLVIAGAWWWRNRKNGKAGTGR
jgi:membrane protein DedA with SNARE-associated domain